LRYSGSQNQLLSASKYQGSTRVVAPQASGVNSKPSEELRDRIITTYKDEIKVQPQRERDYKHLGDLVADLQRRIRGMEAYLKDSQHEYEETLSAQQKVIIHH
jgi:hypothetical protein